MMFFPFFLFSFACLFAGELPSWRAPPPVPVGDSPQAGAVAPVSAPPSVVHRTKRVTDTLRVSDTVWRFDTLRVIDTVQKTDTVRAFPLQYKYVVRYALTSLNVDMSNPEWLDYASVNEIAARDTATLRVGSEEVRLLGNIVDQFGNKLPQTDIVTTGFTIQVVKDRAVIEYRGKNSLAVFSGNFDNSGFLFATGEISETSFLASLFPFNLFFKAAKKKIIIEIVREAYL